MTSIFYLLSSSGSGELKMLERLSAAMTPRQPVGMTPSALALSPDQCLLYIACSDANAVAVADVSGAMSRVAMNSLYRDRLLDDAGSPEGNPVPSRVGQASPIRHVIYIVKENRTYDQVFGEIEKGNGDRSLVLFTPESSANHRKLAREFNLFDNFYVNGDVSADGQNWSSGAIAPDYTNKLWPNWASGRRGLLTIAPKTRRVRTAATCGLAPSKPDLRFEITAG